MPSNRILPTEYIIEDAPHPFLSLNIHAGGAVVTEWRFGPRGVESVGYVLHPPSDTRVLFRIRHDGIGVEISDQFAEGVGIPAGDHDAIVEAFGRAKAAYDAR